MVRTWPVLGVVLQTHSRENKLLYIRNLTGTLELREARGCPVGMRILKPRDRRTQPKVTQQMANQQELSLQSGTGSAPWVWV